MAKLASSASKGTTKVKQAPAEGGKGKPTAEKKELKFSTAATDEEIAAAVAGNLKPRADHGDKKQDNLVRTDELGRPAGRPLGVTTGFPILLAWCYIFQQNEKAAKKDKLTDEGISAWMKKEFPGRETPAFDRPQTCRRDFNLGRFTKGSKPKLESHRYDESGDISTARPGRAPAATKGGAPKGTKAVEKPADEEPKGPVIKRRTAAA